MIIRKMPIYSRNTHQFQWIPLHIRNGGFPPRKYEMRMPIFWLIRKGNELFFINDADETLDSLEIESNGFQTCDNLAVEFFNDEVHCYQNVKSHEAIKIDEYDDFFDLDVFFQLTFRIKSKKRDINIAMLPKKGGINELVILWNTDELGKHFHMKNKNENL